MKQTTIGKVPDNDEFVLSKRSRVIYKIILKEKGKVTFTSTSSGKSFVRPAKTKCWV